MTITVTHWTNRLGNNIIQVLNAVAIGLHLKDNIKLPKHPYFKYETLHLYPTSRRINMDGDFFNIDKYKQNNRLNINIGNLKRILQHLFKYTIPKSDTYSEKDLIIHIRSGDIFGPEPHPIYAQPPLDFYKKVIESNDYTRIILVAEDKGNPCVDALLNLYEDRTEYKQQSLEEDIEIILNAKHIVSSFGTFIPTLSVMSNNMLKVYTMFGFNEYKATPSIQLVYYDYKDYRNSILPWKNTEEQRKIMLEYVKPSS